jgi:hypothetical protein
MTRAAALLELSEASKELEEMRAQAYIAIGSTNPDDEPIREAWALAMARYRAACENLTRAEEE